MNMESEQSIKTEDIITFECDNTSVDDSPVVKKYKSKWCSAINCNNSKNKCPELAFFSFPMEPERSKKWVISSRRVDLKKRPVDQLHRSTVMCEKHFESCCFRDTKGKRKLLKRDAVPSLFDIPNPPPRLTPSRPPPKKRPFPSPIPTTSHTHTQADSSPKKRPFPPLISTQIASTASHTPTVSSVSENCGYSQKRVDAILLHNKLLRKKLMTERTRTCRLKKKISKMTMKMADTQNNRTNDVKSDFQTIKSLLIKYLPQETFELVMAQLQMTQRHKLGRRFTAGEIDFALALFNTSRKAYAIVKKKLCMPSQRTLLNATKKQSSEARNMPINPVPGPVLEQISESEPVSELVSEPVSKLVSKPVLELVSEPAPELVSKPVLELVSERVHEPVSKPVGLVSERVHELVSKPVPELVSEPVPEIVSKPVPELVSERVHELVSKPVLRLVSEPVPEIVSKPVLGLVSDPVPELVSKPVLGLVSEPVSKPVPELVPERLSEPVSGPAPVKDEICEHDEHDWPGIVFYHDD